MITVASTQASGMIVSTVARATNTVAKAFLSVRTPLGRLSASGVSCGRRRHDFAPRSATIRAIAFTAKVTTKSTSPAAI